MVLGKQPVPGRPTTFENSSARAFCACSRCGGSCFLSSIISLFFLPLWETARSRLKYCLKGQLNLKQPNNHLFLFGLLLSSLDKHYDCHGISQLIFVVCFSFKGSSQSAVGGVR